MRYNGFKLGQCILRYQKEREAGEYMEIVWIVVGVIAVVAVLLAAVIFIAMGRFAVRPRVWSVEDTRQDLLNMAIMEGESIEIENEHTIKSFDGYELYVGFVPGDPNNKHYVVLTHGYTSTRYGMYKYAMLYRRMGYNCVIFDQRGHGANERTVTTFGYKEARDLMCVIEDTYERYGRDIMLGLHGESMGSGTQIEALKYHPQVDFIVNDCGYGDILSVLKWKSKLEFKVPGWFATGASFFAKFLYGFTFHQVRPIENLAENKIPICFIHGVEDDFVLPWHSQKMYETTGGYKELHMFEGANHAVSINADVEKYAMILQKFVEKVYSK